MLFDSRNGSSILNDYDLVTIIEPYSGSGQRGADRTGTLPFMAIDLLRADGYECKLSRSYRDDLESFCWCFVWICLCFDIGKERIHETYETWLDPDPEIFMKSKARFDMTVTKKGVMESYELLGRNVIRIWDILA